jgi:hypothetical protein
MTFIRMILQGLSHAKHQQFLLMFQMLQSFYRYANCHSASCRYDQSRGIPCSSVKIVKQLKDYNLIKMFASYRKFGKLFNTPTQTDIKAFCLVC